MASVTQDDVAQIASGFGFTVPESEIGEYTELLGKMKATLDAVMAMEDYQPTPDFEAAPRKDVHFPTKEDNPWNAWAWKCQCSQTSPSSALLEGKTLCLKDNIAMAGVPCLVGTDSFTDWTPAADATVVTRILDHGGTITGKAVCENLSRGAVSCTAATGPVDNPYAKGYSAGGSSSGTAALVGSGAVDMGVGCDQGGSIRIPASLCGLYGFKATTGLVPYSGIASFDASVDYVGPMTATCMDCAVLLEALAGVDGLDDRQIAGVPLPGTAATKYAQHLKDTKEQGVKGLKIGIVKEGLEQALTDPEVEKKFCAAVAGFAKLGATVTEVSIPMHTTGRSIVVVMAKLATHQGMLGKACGRRQMMQTDLLAAKGIPYAAESIEKMPVVSKEGLISAEYAWKNYPLVYAKSVNLIRKVKDAYDAALETVDFLVMPTTVTAANKLPGPNPTPLETINGSAGKLENTSTFNGTGHPALAVPIGFVPAKEDPSLKLPTSMQIVGKFFDEARILQAAYAWENAYNWREF